MPFASFKGFVGVAKDTTDTYLTAAAAAAATTVTVNSATGITTSSTIFFIDGTNTESRAVTNVSSNTLTVAALTNAHSANCPIYAQATASLGPANYLPLTTMEFADDYAMIDDKGLRGSNVDTYAETQAAGKGAFTIGGDVFADTFGYVLGSVFGAVDFTGGSPNQHTFAGMNTNASAGQPTPLIWYYYNGNVTRAFSGAKISEVQIKIDPKNNITWTAKGLANTGIIVTTPTASYSAIVPQVAWTITPTVGGTILPRLLTADITIKRSTTDAILTAQGVQTPYKIWDSALMVDGSLNFVMEDDTDLVNYLNNSQPSLTLAATTGSGASQTGITIQLTKAAYLSGWKPKQTGGSGYVEVGGPFRGISNTTDANTAGGGYSPCRVVLKNAIASGSYQ